MHSHVRTLYNFPKGQLSRMTDLRKGQPCSLALVSPRALRRPGTSVLSVLSERLSCQQPLALVRNISRMQRITNNSIVSSTSLSLIHHASTHIYHPHIMIKYNHALGMQPHRVCVSAATSCMCVMYACSHILYVSSTTHPCTSFM